MQDMLQNKTQVETVNFRLYFKVIIRQNDDDFEIKSKIYSFNLRLVLKYILHSQDVFFRNLLFTLDLTNPSVLPISSIRSHAFL